VTALKEGRHPVRSEEPAPSLSKGSQLCHPEILHRRNELGGSDAFVIRRERSLRPKATEESRLAGMRCFASLSMTCYKESCLFNDTKLFSINTFFQ
jgi:hypothetical protein